MMNSNLGELNATENYFEYNNMSDSYDYEEWVISLILGSNALRDIILVICCIGFVGNGYVIWLLGFQIKRNVFTTFILNLAIADFGYLTFTFIYIINSFTHFQASEIFIYFYTCFMHMMYISANFLLTAISIDRCVAVLFPIWHRCSRPKRLSSSVCLIVWISSFILTGIITIMNLFLNYSLPTIHFLLTAIICLPLITLSTIVLFIKVCVKPKQKNKGRLLLMILITLLCFLILAFPLSAFAITDIFLNFQISFYLWYWMAGTTMCACINSSINPVIYFLVGRKRRAQSKESMKVILENVFKEGEATGGR